jgi:predicted PurR-regulated permease PerM
MGVAVTILAFFGFQGDPQRPLSRALLGRIERFASAFENVVVAQVEISAINTVLTAGYLLLALPLFGSRLPFSGTLVAVTFLAGLIPVVGNLISNTTIVVMSLSVSPWTALASLGFLVGIHKLEYLINARIVGARIGATAWEILTAIIVFEVAFGVPGVVLAPIIYAYVKNELVEQNLV